MHTHTHTHTHTHAHTPFCEEPFLTAAAAEQIRKHFKYAENIIYFKFTFGKFKVFKACIDCEGIRR